MNQGIQEKLEMTKEEILEKYFDFSKNRTKGKINENF